MLYSEGPYLSPRCPSIVLLVVLMLEYGRLRLVLQLYALGYDE